VASNAKLLEAYLKADGTLNTIVGQRIWTRPLRRGDGPMDSLAFNADTGHPRTLLTIIEKGARKQLQADVDRQKIRLDSVLQDFEFYFYAHAVDTGKDELRQAKYRVKELLDGHTFTTELGFRATVNWRGEPMGLLDSEEFPLTVQDWCVYELRTRLS
jgi:hypothetical protein